MRRGLVTLLEDIEARPVDWLWVSRIPLGMLTIFDGDPGLGKSTILLDLGARVSRGATMPDGSPGPEAAGVVVLTAEDDLARVVRPRLDAAQADLTRVATVMVKDKRGVREPTISPGDLAAVEEGVDRVGAKLIVVDPLMAYLPADVNSNRDQDVRRALVDLRQVAERTGAAVIVVRHLNKALGGPALYRGGGSIGIIGAARCGLLLAADPAARESGRVLAVVKSNLAQKPRAIRLQLVQSIGHGCATVVWGDPCDLSPAQLLEAEEPERRHARAEAQDFLEDILAQGSVPAKEVKRAAADAGIAVKTLQRARTSLGVISEKVGRPMEAGQQWFWSLPACRGDQDGPKTAISHDRDHLQDLERHDPDEMHASSKTVMGAPKKANAPDDDPLRGGGRPRNLEQAAPSVTPIGATPNRTIEGPKEVIHDGGLLRGNGPDAEVPSEEGQFHAHDHLRVAGSTNGTDVHACPNCGGRTLHWAAGAICTRCHCRVPERPFARVADGVGLKSAMRTAPE